MVCKKQTTHRCATTDAPVQRDGSNGQLRRQARTAQRQGVDRRRRPVVPQLYQGNPCSKGQTPTGGVFWLAGWWSLIDWVLCAPVNQTPNLRCGEHYGCSPPLLERVYDCMVIMRCCQSRVVANVRNGCVCKRHKSWRWRFRQRSCARLWATTLSMGLVPLHAPMSWQNSSGTKSSWNSSYLVLNRRRNPPRSRL